MPKKNEVFIDFENFKLGLYALEDTTKAPFGSARIMKNMQITDRGGVGPRLGTELLGTANSNGNGIKGFYNFRKSFDTEEILIKTYDDEMEAFSKNNSAQGWFKLKDSFTANKEFGFATSLVNVESEDGLVFCNRFDDYSRYRGSITLLDGALAGAETDVTVDSVLTGDVFESQIATGSTATLLSVTTVNWAPSQWVGLYVHITSGALSGKIRRITATTNKTITFNTLGSDPGNATFEIKKLAFPLAKIDAQTTIAFVDSDPDTITDSGNGFIKAGFKAGDKIVISGSSSNDGTYTIATVVAGTITLIATDSLAAEGASASVTILLESMSIIYNGTVVAYTGIDTATTFQVASAHAASDNEPVSIVPEVFPENPKGNRFTNFLNRIIVAGVRSALARDNGGVKQGFTSAGSYFVSKLSNPVDFDFSAARIAGEGDIVSTPYGGGEIEDVAHQENTAYIFKKRYIESIKYSQDENDLAVREPLKAEVGSIGRVIKGSDDIYFMTEDKRFTSIGRVIAKDLTPQTENLGFKIKRLLDVFVPGVGFGRENEDKIYIPLKSSSAATSNDIVLVYNKVNDSFEGIWEIPAFGIERFNNLLYYAESNGADVYQLLKGHSDVKGTTRFPISAEYATHFMNLASSKGMLQALNSIYFEGYIKGNTTINFNIFKDFADEAFLSFAFEGTEEVLLDGRTFEATLGLEALALSPIGSISSPDTDGRRHFQFRVYFPFQYGQAFSVGWQSNLEDDDYELTRYGLGLKESVATDTTKIKTV